MVTYGARYRLVEQSAAQPGRLLLSTAPVAWSFDHLGKRIIDEEDFARYDVHKSRPKPPHHAPKLGARSGSQRNRDDRKAILEFAQLQPVAEKPWTTFMGRVIRVPDMPIEAQKQLGIFDKRAPGAI